MSNANEIKFEPQKILLFGGIFFCAVAALFIWVYISLFPDGGRDGMIAMILAFVLVIGPLMLLGGYCIYAYFSTRKKLQERLQKYGKENVLLHISQATIKECRSSFYGGKVYFTDKYIVDPQQTILEYREIARMYRQVRRSVSYIVLKLVSGAELILCSGITNEEIVAVMQICYRQNQSIVFDDGMPVMPKEWTPQGKKYQLGKNLMRTGICILVWAVVFPIFFFFLISSLGGGMSTNMERIFCLLFSLALGMIFGIIGLVLVIVGHQKMKKYKRAVL